MSLALLDSISRIVLRHVGVEMSRRWTDPRNGTTWLVDAMPFDMGPSPDPARPAPMGWTMMFVSGLEHRALPVGYDLGTHLARLKDMELIALLDAAAMEG